jgi:arsenite methyltransferase
LSETSHQHQQRVAERYAAAAHRITADPAHGAISPEEADNIGQSLYGDDLDSDLAMVAAGSIGCGNPTAVADLHPGETVLDLGSGAGLDVLLSARRVGPTGRAIGLDMTGEMLDLTRRNASTTGATNVEFLRGTIENIPLPDASVDVVISNCVIALSADQPRVFAEIHRVLRPGGRLGINDVIAGPDLTEEQRAVNTTDCLGSAQTEATYLALLRSAGLRDATITTTHEIGNGLHAAIVKATKP